MAETEPETDSAKPEPTKPRRRRSRIGGGLIPSLFVLAVFIVFVVLTQTGQTVPLPDWAQDRIETSVRDRMETDGVVLGDLSLSFASNGKPQVNLSNIQLGDASGGAVAALNDVHAELQLGALLRGRIAPQSVTLDGAQITLRRNRDGRFSVATQNVSAPDPQTAPRESRTLAEFLARVEALFRNDALRSVETVEANGVVISVEDARSGRIWQATNAAMTLRRGTDDTSISLTSDVFNGTDDVAELQLSFDFDQRTQKITLGANVDNMDAADIAAQSPILAWLGVLDAPISGAVRAEYDGDAGLSSLAGTLDISAGALKPSSEAEPLSFNSARTYFTFDPDRQRLDFSEVALVSERFSLNANGHTYLNSVQDGWPQAFLGQFKVAQARLEAEGFFEDPVELTDLRTDFRLTLDPFVIDFGQISVSQPKGNVQAKAKVEALDSGWSLAFDAQTQEIGHETILAYWPLVESEGTRTWLSENVMAGRIFDVSASVRKSPGNKPDFSLSFDYEDAVVRFLDHMPEVRNGRGRATMIDRGFTLVIDEGDVTTKSGGVLDGSGTVFSVDNIQRKPSIGRIALRATGGLTDSLTLLNNRPIRLLERAKRGIDLATGHVSVNADIALPLKKKIDAEDVTYNVAARLNDVTSKTIVRDRTLAARSASLSANPTEVSVNGAMTLDGVPFTAKWSQPIGPNSEAAASRVAGTVAISSDTLEALNLALPSDLISGQTEGQFEVVMRPDSPPKLSLTSDLVGMRVGIDGIAWTKPASERARFEAKAELGEVPEIELIALDAPGLNLTGRLQFDSSGIVSDVILDRLAVGSWLDAPVRLTPQGSRRPYAISINGGQLDFRGVPKGSGGGTSAPTEVNLDTLILTDGIRLAPLSGRLDASSGGFSGVFQGRVNGQTPVRATLAPANGGTAVRIQSNRADGVLRDAGLTPNANGGTLDIVMTPVVGSTGVYNGEFLIENVRLRKAPVMADLLDAISVVGLIDQLAGPGIHFDTVDGTFRLSPGGLTLKEAAAVGASMGISADGVFDLSSKRMDVSGVISPVYFVNAIGRAVSRRGEGLFGFNYRMRGTTTDPVVRVNPLSILTPGFFREIFRQSPPTQ